MSTYRRCTVGPKPLREIECDPLALPGGFGLEKVEVRGGEDQHGESAIFVEAGADRFPCFRHGAEGREIGGPADREERLELATRVLFRDRP